MASSSWACLRLAGTPGVLKQDVLWQPRLTLSAPAKTLFPLAVTGGQVLNMFWGQNYTRSRVLETVTTAKHRPRRWAD